MGQDTLRKNDDRQPVMLFPDQSDSMAYWIDRYVEFAVKGVKVEDRKITLHLERFREYLVRVNDDDRLTAITQRNVQDWQKQLYRDGDGYMPSTVNGHLASLSGFTSWVMNKAPQLLPLGDPTKGVRDLHQLPLVSRALSDKQVASLKNTCDRLELLYAKKDRSRFRGELVQRERSRPKRDRAMIYTLLSTGIRREELRDLNLMQIEPNDPVKLRYANISKITRVRGKGGTEREVFLSKDAKKALADYLEHERPLDAGEFTEALFLTAAAGGHARKPTGRFSLQAINQLFHKIGELHDREFPDRPISPLRPHDLRHTFAFQLVEEMKRNHGGVDVFELERRLGHRSQNYIQIYTQGPEAVSASYIENL